VLDLTVKTVSNCTSDTKFKFFDPRTRGTLLVALNWQPHN